MSKIDLSKAKIGDKFRTRDCQILEYVGEDLEYRDDKYKLIDKLGYIKHFYQSGEYLYNEEYSLDLVEQVFDDEKDTTDLEIVEAMNQAINENSEKAAEREQELQRRQEVLKYADMLFFNQKDTRIALFGYDVAIETAEIIVKSRDKYLKEGKLC